MKTLLTIIMFIFSFAFVNAQEFVYKPINPAFGGNSFNYSGLLGSADAQNQYEEEEEDPIKTQLDRFKENLNRQLLDKVTQSLFRQQFNEDELTPGTYEYGTLFVTITETDQGLLVDILDKDTGDQTQILIPQ